MILQLFLGLVLIAVLFFIIGQEKRRRIWSVLLFGAVLGLLYAFFEQINAIGINNVMYTWIPHQTLQASLSFVPIGQISSCLRIMSLCFAALIYLNIIYKKEDYSLYINNFILLNFAALIVLLSAQDFIQLMVGSCCFTIIGYYLINDITAKIKFIFYNFLAEMSLFMALAIVYASINTTSLTALSRYIEIGHHKDLVSLLLMCTVFIKCGMFLFQNQFMDLKRLSLNRVATISLFSSPLSGVIIFLRILPLIQAAEYIEAIFIIIICISVVWSIIGTLIIDNIKAKMLYLNMLFYAFVLWQMWGGGAIFFEKLIYLYPALLAVYISFLFVSVSASDEICISQMGGFYKRLWGNLLLSLIAIFVFVGCFIKNFSPSSAWSFLFIFLSLCAFILHGMFLGKMHSDERVEALLKNIGIYYWVPYIAALSWYVYELGIWSQKEIWIILGSFILFMLIVPIQALLKLAAIEEIQNADILHRIYMIVFIMPLRLLGRVLWLAIDFVVIERSIIGSISHSTAFVVQGLQKIQGISWSNYLLMLLIGVMIILLNLGWYIYG